MKTIQLNYKISGIKIEIPFSAVCSIINNDFCGFIVIEYRPDRKILDYVTLEQKISLITKKPTIAEDLAKDIFNEITKAISPKKLKVLVDVRRSSTHQPVQVWIEK